VRFVTIDALVPDRPSDQVFHTLVDYARYPELTPVVRDVQVWTDPGGDLISSWEVNFRNGILRWTERDVVDHDRMRIDFTQTEGDVAEFAGSWSCRVEDCGTAVRFEALVDLGIASLADVLDPIAARTLAETITGILVGLFGEGVRFDAIDHETTELPAGALPFLSGVRA
jgi:ribosome-associated toxin RatA of RatAB toxin-antitoxin module